MVKLTFDIIINSSQMCVKSNHIAIHLHAVEMQVKCYLLHNYLHSIANMPTDLLHIYININKVNYVFT